jgi:glycosyltransferase involved in cell wall biosynthesis
MPPKLPITVLLAVRNEARNLPRSLAGLAPAERVVLLDSGSTDGTPDLARQAGAEVVPFVYRGGYPKKRQWALDTLPIATAWVLLLDADEAVPPALWDEIRAAIGAPAPCQAYYIAKGFHFLGRRFRFGGFSHRAILLFQRGCARFEQLLDDPPGALDMEVHERLIVNGRTGALATPLIHEDFKGLEAYIDRHNRYSTWEARLRHRYLTTGVYGRDAIPASLSRDPQSFRRLLKTLALRIPGEPILWFLYHYLLALGCLEGVPGLIASQLRMAYIQQVRAKLRELRIKEPVTAQDTCRDGRNRPACALHADRWTTTATTTDNEGKCICS